MKPDAASLPAKIAAALAPHEEVLEAYVFGSRATATAGAHSDIDVAVFIADTSSEASPFGSAAELATALIAALGTNAVDVVVLNEAPPLLYHRVLRDGIRVLARDLHATTTREGLALSRYCDFVPQLAKIDAAHRARIAGDRFGR